MSTFSDPLVERYASAEMLACFSQEHRYQTWRKLWLELARAEKQLGLPIHDKQIKALQKALELPVDFAKAAAYEKEFQHDVMAHLHAFGDTCPEAKPILHLGATSAFITDNADLLLMRDGLKVLIQRLQKLTRTLGDFCLKHKDRRTVGYTHFQVAIPTTVGKRAGLWLQDLVMDGEELLRRFQGLKLRGAKGTVGTQASFLKLFDGDFAKVEKLDQLIARAFEVEATFDLTGQTYTRKADSQILTALCGLGESASKLSNDLRLLQHLHEIDEPFSKKQVGSSAMPFKRNPIYSERICSLARILFGFQNAAYGTTATQWFERTLDDSAGRRLYIPQSFLIADAILVLLQKIVDGMTVNEKVIEKHLQEQLPFLLTEMLLMESVKEGESRQEVHEKIRGYAMETFHAITEQGSKNDLMDRLAADPLLKGLVKRLRDEKWEESYLVGAAPMQVSRFVAGPLKKFLGVKI